MTDARPSLVTQAVVLHYRARAPLQDARWSGEVLVGLRLVAACEHEHETEHAALTCARAIVRLIRRVGIVVDPDAPMTRRWSRDRFRIRVAR